MQLFSHQQLAGCRTLRQMDLTGQLIFPQAAHEVEQVVAYGFFQDLTQAGNACSAIGLAMK